MSDVTVDSLNLRNNRAVISESDSRDFQFYSRLREEAIRRGIPLEVVSDAEYAEIAHPSSPEPTMADADGVVTDANGDRVFYVLYSDVASHDDYVRLRAQAQSLSAELQLVDVVPERVEMPDVGAEGVEE
jgi:hypothetical protein